MRKKKLSENCLYFDVIDKYNHFFKHLYSILLKLLFFLRDNNLLLSSKRDYCNSNENDVFLKDVMQTILLNSFNF